MFRKLYDWIAINEVRIASSALLMTGVILFLITRYYNPNVNFSWAPDLGLYNQPEFWENVLVESHGMLLDLLIIGVFIFWLQKRTASRREKRLLIQRYQEELDDYRGWLEDEAAYKVAGLIKRLKKEGVKNLNFDMLNLAECPKETIELAVKLKAHIISLEKAKLNKANLVGASFGGANLQQTKLYNANLQEADLEEANLQKADLGGAILRKARLGSANLQDANLAVTDLREANLGVANLKRARLTGTDLRKAKLWEANLERARLEEADLEKAEFGRANLHNARLEKANLQGAYLYEADLTGTSLEGAILYGAYLLDAKVVESDWIEKLKDWNVKGIEDLETRYYVDSTPQSDEPGVTYYLIKEQHVSPDRCIAKTKKGKRCRRKPKVDYQKCAQHLNIIAR